MATGKTINELTQAASLSSSDMLAIAQSENNEAVKASVSQLASAVAELNETGSLSELVYATSQGKNLLAQNLKNKGISASPSETLISLADKVNALNLDISTEDIIVTHPVYAGNYNKTDPIKFFCVAGVDNGIFFYNGGSIYHLPKLNVRFTSVNVAIENTDASITLETPLSNSSYIYMRASDNGQYLIIWGSSASDALQIYSYDKVNKAFTYIKSISASSITSFPTSSSWGGVIEVANSGEFIFYCQYTSTNAWMFEIEHETTSTLGSIGGGMTPRDAIIDEENNTIYLSNNIGFGNFTYSKTDSTYSYVANSGKYMSYPWGSANNSAYEYYYLSKMYNTSNGVIYLTCGYDAYKFANAKLTSSNGSYSQSRDYNTRIKIYKGIKNTVPLASNFIPVDLINYNTGNISTTMSSNSPLILGILNMLTVTTDNNITTLTLPSFIGGYMTYNHETAKLEKHFSGYIASSNNILTGENSDTAYSCGDSSYGAQSTLVSFYENDSIVNFVLAQHGQYLYIYSSGYSPSSQLYTFTLRKNQLIGKNITNNSGTILYCLPVFVANRANDGWYDVKTSVSPKLPDSN